MGYCKRRGKGNDEEAQPAAGADSAFGAAADAQSVGQAGKPELKIQKPDAPGRGHRPRRGTSVRPRAGSEIGGHPASGQAEPYRQAGVRGAVGPPSGFPRRGLPSVYLTPALYPPSACPQSPGGLMGMRGSLPAAGGWEMGASFPARAGTGCGGWGLILSVPREGGHRGVSGAGRGCGSVISGVPVGCFAPFRGRVGIIACPTCACSRQRLRRCG